MTEETMIGHFGFEFVRTMTPERKALFVRFRMCGFSPSWAAFFAARADLDFATGRSRIDCYESDEDSVRFFAEDNCSLVPPHIMEQLGD